MLRHACLGYSRLLYGSSALAQANLRTSYCASKFALLGFFDALRMEELAHRIHVTNVCPVRSHHATHMRIGCSDAPNYPQQTT